jgi:hypothetical protein
MTKAGLPWLPLWPKKTRLFIQLEADQFGETATFRLSQCSSIMKILFTPDTTMLDHHEFGAFGKSHGESRSCHATPKFLMF